MSDERLPFSQASDGSRTFPYIIRDDAGHVLNASVDVSAEEGSDLATAVKVSEQKAADIKQAWQDSIAIATEKASVAGPVALPLSTKAKAAKDAQLEAAAAESVRT